MLDEIAKYTLEPSQTNKPDVSSCCDVTIYVVSPTYPNIVNTHIVNISPLHICGVCSLYCTPVYMDYNIYQYLI